jgi:predicted Zn finger-like uncharacterized protein
MKFYCDACNTKYAIADEKVRGKVLKVRCKKCENIITVREARTPAGESASAPASADAGVPQENWYFAVNGVTTGPLSLDAIRGKFSTGEVGDEAYVWHDTFEKWEPVATVDTFAEALAAGQALKPRAKTLGFTGKLEAVKAPAGPNPARAGKVPEPDAATRPAQESLSAKLAAQSKDEPPKKEAAPTGPREDKLAALRAKLKQKNAAEKDSSDTGKPSTKPSEPKASKPASVAAPKPTAKAKPVKAEAPAATESPGKGDKESNSGLGLPVPKVDDSSTKAPAASESAPAEAAEPKQDADDVIPGVGELPRPSTTSTSDIFDIPTPADEDDLEADEDAVPFFPPAAAAAGGTAPAEQSALTGSLLIQLDQIQKKGRGSKFFAVAAIVLFVGTAAAIGIYIGTRPEVGESNFAKAEGPGSGEHRELKFNTYSDDQQRKILELGDEELSMEFDESEAGETEEETGEKAEVAAAKPVAKSKPVAKTSSKSSSKSPDNAPAETESEEPPKESGKTLALARIKEASPSDEPTAEETRRKAEMFRSATSSVKRETTNIARPEDKLQGGVNPNATLSREEALAGMKKVSRSVQLCRERHMRRGGSFDSPKIFVTVTVNGDGRVGKFAAEPQNLQNTEFGRCMNSHKGRWRFAAFGGQPQQVRRRFIIQ